MTEETEMDEETRLSTLVERNLRREVDSLQRECAARMDDLQLARTEMENGEQRAMRLEQALLTTLQLLDAEKARTSQVTLDERLMYAEQTRDSAVRANEALQAKLAQLQEGECCTHCGRHGMPHRGCVLR